jgi:hypothetical protein
VQDVTEGDPGIEVDYSNPTLEDMVDEIQFFTIQNCIQNYINYLNVYNSSYYDNSGNKILTDDEIAEKIYGLLDKEYIEQYSITKKNLYNYVKQQDEQYIFVPIKMKALELTSMRKYVVYGILIDADENLIQEVYYQVNKDLNNISFSIIPLDGKKYSSIDDITVSSSEYEINLDEDKSNTVNNVTITDQFLSQQYLLRQRRLMVAMPEMSYDLLDEEYRELRFGSLEKYVKYVKENKDHISRIATKKYEVTRDVDETKILCQDQYENYYIFTINSISDYTVQLDGYTIPPSEFYDIYLGYTKQELAAHSSYLWIMMLNNRDYESAYNALNETFRQNNYPTLEDFEKYAKKVFTSYYSVESQTAKVASGTSYEIVIKLTDMVTKKEYKKMTTIVTTSDILDVGEYTFELAFSEN